MSMKCDCRFSNGKFYVVQKQNERSLMAQSIMNIEEIFYGRGAPFETGA